MSQPNGSGDPGEPTDELLLAQALEACIRAERVAAGSSREIAAQLPTSARSELEQLLTLAQALEASSDAVRPSPEFYARARAELMRQIGGPNDVGQPVVLTSIAGRGRGPASWRWLLRGAGGLAAAALTVVAALTASASALPGDTLYGVKQAKEEVALRLAADDQARALALLLQANARLDETQRLLEQGRTEDAIETAQRYDRSVDRATSTLVVAIGGQPADAAVEQFASTLEAQQARIETVLPEAPEPARIELREALVTAERGRAIAARPTPARPTLSRPARPTEPPQALVPARVEEQPTPTAVVVAEPIVIRAPDRDDRVADAQSRRASAEGEDRRAGGPGPRVQPAPGPAQVQRPAPQTRQSGSGRGEDGQRGGQAVDANEARGGDDDGGGQRAGPSGPAPVAPGVGRQEARGDDGDGRRGSGEAGRPAVQQTGDGGRSSSGDARVVTPPQPARPSVTTQTPQVDRGGDREQRLVAPTPTPTRTTQTSTQRAPP
ncbi:MAG TPA: DUF5667 domain-containing protein, partial [Chloroflexota bacterium]|nr:DUF5667 domain-containing protein [Chloroflexota bacterium]